MLIVCGHADCLDNGNNKKALQEVDRLLKKQKDLSCAKVSKAIFLSCNNFSFAINDICDPFTANKVLWFCCMCTFFHPA